MSFTQRDIGSALEVSDRRIFSYQAYGEKQARTKFLVETCVETCMGKQKNIQQAYGGKQARTKFLVETCVETCMEKGRLPNNSFRSGKTMEENRKTNVEN